MSEELEEITVRFLSPSQKPMVSKAYSVLLTAKDGLAEIFPQHAKAFFLLKEGEINLHQGQIHHTFIVNGGVAKIENNELLIISERITARA